MTEQARARVDELGEKLVKRNFAIGTRKAWEDNGYYLEEVEVTDYRTRYTHPRRERRAAVKELREIRRTSSDEGIRKSCQDYLFKYGIHDEPLRDKIKRFGRFLDEHPEGLAFSLIFGSVAAVILAPHVYDLIKRLAE